MFIHIVDTFGEDWWLNIEQIIAMARDSEDHKTSIFLAYNSKVDYLRTNEPIECIMEKIEK